MTMAVLDAYTGSHAQGIESEPIVVRAGVLVVEYLKAHATIEAPISFWTPARQIDFARYLNQTYGHVPATIHRYTTVLNAAFHDATKSKLREDPLGRMVEGSLLSHAPQFAHGQAALARELKIADPRPKTFVPSLEEMARFIDALGTEHLRRWIVIALATWARPKAVTDFDPTRQWDRRTNLIDLNPPGRAQTTKRRSQIICCRTLAGCLEQWAAEDAARRAKQPDRPTALLVYKRKRVGSVKQAVKRIADDIGLPAITQKTPRTFMSTMVRKLCPATSREQRSLWLGHVVKEGSRTTDHYEISDPEYLSDIALATDHVLQRLRSLCKEAPFAIEVLLNRSDLRRIGAKVSTTSRGK